jgi:glycosyltransferase involved in cell wall biosynthesis
LIYNGIDFSEFTADPDSSGLNKTTGIKHEHVIGMVSHLEPLKGHKVLLNAAKSILKADYNIKLSIVGHEAGGTKQYVHELKSLANDLGIAKHVMFLGYRKNVAEILKTFDICVLCSFEEGFGRVLVEYMACGKPVIATNVGGIPEIVVDGETGILVPVGDHKSLAEAIIRLIDDPLLSRQMGNDGRLRVQKYFDLKMNVRKTQELYQKLIV